MRVHGVDDLDNGKKHPQMVNRYADCSTCAGERIFCTFVILVHSCKVVEPPQ